MEITVSKTALSDKLKSVGRIIQPKNSLPAYDNFLFVIDEFGVILVTAGEEGGRISTNIDGTADFTNYTFMANAKTLLDGLKEIPEQPLIISILEKELIVKYANGKFSIPIEKGDQYPSMSTDDTASPFLVSGNDLLYGIRQVLICSANDELRPVLNGVYFDIGLDSMSFVATDGTRLAMIENPSAYTRKERAAFILPSKFAKVLSNIVPEDCMEVEISVNQTNILFEFDSYRLICRMIEGRYPNYRAVIPQKQPNRAVLKKADIVSALKRVSVFCDESSSLVVLKFDSDSLKIAAHDLDFSKSAEETITLQSGCNIEIGFRSSFLIEMMNNIPSEDIAITMSDPSQASLLTRCDEVMGKENQSFKQVIQSYLEQRAKRDSLFATSFAKQNKNIDECCNYIIGEAKKRGGSVVCMSDDEVFGLAVHYYDEDDIKVSKHLQNNQKLKSLLLPLISVKG